VFDLGNSLREARVRQGLDYPQVELATKIRAKYIRALEDETFELLPSETYIKGFLRSYAEYLGLDGQLYVDEYTSRYGGERWYDETPRRARVHQHRGLERKVVLAALAGIAALTALVIVAWKFGGGNSSNGLPPTLSTRSSPAAPKKTVLQLRGIRTGSYVEVHRASKTGKLVLAATIGPGDAQRIVGTRFWLYIKRSGNVRVSLGGRTVSLPARRNLRVLVTPTRTALTGA
jgi:cytoskeletal protein RodZ